MSIKNGYHFDDFNRRYYRNEDGSKIPQEQCLCSAYEPSECCCDCTSWHTVGSEYTGEVEVMTEAELLKYKIYDERAYE